MPAPTRQPPLLRRPVVTTAPAIVHEVLATPGSPLPDDVQELARRSLDFDASNIRIHTDGHAAASAAAVHARAYTVGRHIAFAADAFAPHSPDGRALLRHELQHASEQQHAAVPGRGGLVVADAPVLERSAELAEHGTWTRPQRIHSAILQRKLEATALAILPDFVRRLRIAINGSSTTAALAILRQLPAGAGPELTKLDPDLRRRIGNHLLSAPDERVDALAILSDAAPGAPHVAVARDLQRSLVRGSRTFVAQADLAAPRTIEADFNRDFYDAVPGHRTLLSALGVGDGGLRFNLSSGLIDHFYADALHACMLLDHTPTDAEYAGVRLAAGSAADFLYTVRNAAAQGDDPVAFLALLGRWYHSVQLREGWTRGLVTKPWCTLDLRATVEAFIDEGPRLQLRAFFAAVDAREQERLADADFGELVQNLGRTAAHAKLAERIQGLLAPSELPQTRGVPTRTRDLVRGVLRQLRYLPTSDLKAVDAAFAARYGAPIAAKIRTFPPLTGEFFSVLGLLANATFQDRTVKFASAIFREQTLEAINVLYQLPDTGREQFHREYAAAFSGLQPNDGDVTPYRHVRALFTTRWKREKLSDLLEHPLTDAEELYFSTDAIESPSNAEVGGLLDKTRGNGTRDGFLKLLADWDRHVLAVRWWNANRPLSVRPLRLALRRALSGTPLVRAENLFQQYVDNKDPDETGVGINDLQPAYRLLERAILDDDTTQTKRELELIGKLIRELRAADTSGRDARKIADVERNVRSLLESRVRAQRLSEAQKQLSLIELRGGKLADADELYRQWLLAQIDGNEIAALAILKLVTQHWADGSLASLETAANTPTLDAQTGEVLRSKYSLKDLKASDGFVRNFLNGRLRGIFRRVQIMANPVGDVTAVGWLRLDDELTSRGSTGERLRGAFDFLAVLSVDDITKVLARFAELSLSRRRGNPAERFVNYLIDEFGLASQIVGIAERVRPQATTIPEIEARTRFVEASRHTGYASEVGGRLAAIWGGRDVGPAIEQSLRNLEALDRDVRLQPDQLAANLQRSGSKTAADAAKQEYAEVKANVEIENQLKKDFAEITGQVIEIGVRALLVGALGPAGLIGLSIGLLTVGGGKVANELLLGANYDLASPENLASLLTEVTGSFSEYLEVEKRIGRLIENVFKESPLLKQVAAGTSSKLLTAGFDGLLERVIQQNDLPDITKLASTLAGTLTDSIGKRLGDKLKFNVTAFTGFNERWIIQLANQYLAGPPPKATIITSGIGQAFKLAQDVARNGRDELDIELLKKRARDWAITTTLTGLAVGTSFTVVKAREGRKRSRQLADQGEALAILAAEHAGLRDLIESLPPGERGPALLKLARDPDFGRTRLPASSDPNDPRGLYAGQTQRRLLDDLSKLIDKDGKLVPDALKKVQAADAQTKRTNRLQAEANQAAKLVADDDAKRKREADAYEVTKKAADLEFRDRLNAEDRAAKKQREDRAVSKALAEETARKRAEAQKKKDDASAVTRKLAADKRAADKKIRADKQDAAKKADEQKQADARAEAAKQAEERAAARARAEAGRVRGNLAVLTGSAITRPESAPRRTPVTNPQRRRVD